MLAKINSNWRTSAIVNCGSFDQNCGGLYEKTFEALSGLESGASQFKTLGHTVLNRKCRYKGRVQIGTKDW